MKLTNKLGLPDSIYGACLDNWKPSETRISISQLIDSPLIRKLTIEHWDEISEDVSDKIWALLGLATHYIIEKTKMPDALKEEYLKVKIGDSELSGRPDILEGKNLIDLKITSVWSFIYGSRTKDWENQLNCYRYLYEEYGFPVESLELILILRDWSKGRAEREKEGGYPQSQIQVIKPRLWTMEETETYIKERLRIHAEKDYKCSDEERWCKPPVFKVIKQSYKRARKNFNTLVEAEKFRLEQNDKDKLDIQHEPLVYARCLKYCRVSQFCPILKDENWGIKIGGEINDGE